MSKYVKTTHKGNKSVYHTDEECHSLNIANDYKEISERQIDRMGLEKCSRCAGENPQANVDQDQSYQNATIND